MLFFEHWHRMDADYFDVEYGCDFSYPPHVHRCYEAILLTEGEMEVTVDGASSHLSPGEVAFIFPNQIHSMQTHTHSRHRLFIFAPELIAAFDRRHAQQLPHTPRLSLESGPLLPLLCGLEKTENLYAIKGVLYCLCALAEEQLNYTESNIGRSGNVTLLREILNYIQSNFQEECSLSGLSAAIKYDITYLSKFFTANMGVSFTSYVTQVRISHACYLLRNTHKSILDISHECGNLSLRTFNRNFLSLRGCTPSEYRTGSGI